MFEKVEYQKRSRRHGTMVLRSYASGDGSISLRWASVENPNGPALSELVTESDASEFLEIHRAAGGEVSPKWSGWDVMVLGSLRSPDVRLFRPVQRPAKTSKMVVLDGEEYKYKVHYRDGRLHDVGVLTLDDRRCWVEVDNLGVRNAVWFFLQNEEALKAQGFETRAEGLASQY